MERRGVRARSDDLPALWLTCANHQALCSELTPQIANLLKQQGFEDRSGILSVCRGVANSLTPAAAMQACLRQLIRRQAGHCCLFILAE
jgi:hypothetical protein